MRRRQAVFEEFGLPINMYYNPKEKFCAQCLSMHLPGAHKTNKVQPSPFN